MAKGIVVQISGDGEGAKRALEMVREQLRETQHEESRTVEITERLKGALETVGLYMGIREAIDVLKELTEGSAEYGEQIQKAAVKTGMTAETLSILHYAADLAHTDVDGLQGGIAKLAINMESAANGNTKLAATFRAAGIDAKDLARQPDGVDQAFKRFAATLANTENAQKRDALAKALMGKAGVELIPVLMDVGSRFDELAAGADKAGVKMDELRAQRLAALDDELDKLKENVKGAGLSFTDGLAPGLVKVFEILGEGQSSEDMFLHWGQATAGILARLAALAYDFASAMERAFALTEGGKLSGIGRKDWESADALLKKGRELEELSNQIASGKMSNVVGSGDRPKRPGGGAGDLPDTGKPGKSLNPIDEARAQLVQEQARLQLEIVKAEGQAELAEVEAQHRMLLVGDQDYFDRKFAIQNREYDAEQKRLETQQTTLQALEARQHGDKLLKRKDGVSAEELKTQRELVQVQEQMAALHGKRLATESGYNAELSASNQAAELAGLRAMAMLERERNDGIEAQIALIRKEHEVQAQKSTLAGGTEADAAAIRQTGELAVKKLQLGEIQDDINRVEADHRRVLDEVNDAVEKGDMSKRTAAQRVKQANAEELKQLQDLAAQYRELAEAIGDPNMLEKAKDLQTDIDNLGRVDHRGTFGKELADGMQSMTSSIMQNAALGKQSVSEMAASMLQDMERLALKMAEEKFLAPLFEGAMGGIGGGGGSSNGAMGGGFGGFLKGLFSGEHHMSGGVGSDMPQMVGEAGPEMWQPPTRGGTYATNAVLKGLANGGGGGGKAPNVTTNVINQSSQPVQATTSQPSFDSQLREMVTHVILTDAHEGGSISQVFGR